MMGPLSSYYWYMYGNSTLHTNFNYFRPNRFDARSVPEEILTRDIDQRINMLREKEEEFYRKFGASNYAQFMTILRDLLNGQDGRVLHKLSKVELSKDLFRFIKNNAPKDLTEGEVIIRFENSDAAKKIPAILKEFSKIKIQNNNLSGRVTRIDGNNIAVALNVPALKIILNKVLGTKFKKKSFYADTIANLLRKEDLSEILTFSDQGVTLSQTEVSQRIKYRPYPWGYTNSELRAAQESGDPNLLPQLEEAIRVIKQYVMGMFNAGSAMLQSAAEAVLDRVVSLDYNIFFTGANWQNGLAGAFGEFGTAVLFEYLVRRLGMDSSVIGQITNIVGKENRKVDIELFSDFGVQVKNYTTFESDARTKTARTIEVNQNPAQFAQYFEDMEEEDHILGFFANYFFNSDIQERTKLNYRILLEKLEDELMVEVLRLSDGMVPDTVTFYSIGMNYFVPGSAILEAYKESTTRLEVSIEYNGSMAWTPTSNVDLMGENDYWHLDGPPFENKRSVTWKPTERNRSLYNSLIKRDIKIQARMVGLVLNNFYLI